MVPKKGECLSQTIFKLRHPLLERGKPVYLFQIVAPASSACDVKPKAWQTHRWGRHRRFVWLHLGSPAESVQAQPSTFFPQHLVQ